VKRVAVAVAGLLFVLAGCGTAAPSVPGVGSIAIPSVSIPSGANASALASAAVTQLCSTDSPAGLTTIAGELDKVAAGTDTSAVEAKLDALVVGLQQLPVSGTATPLRDAAGAAILQLQTSIKDPAKRQDAAKKASAALRIVRTAVCK
jgi:hypothetical protein